MSNKDDWTKDPNIDFNLGEILDDIKEKISKLEHELNEWKGRLVTADNEQAKEIAELKKYYNIENTIGNTDHDWKGGIIDRIINIEEEITELTTISTKRYLSLYDTVKEIINFIFEEGSILKEHALERLNGEKEADKLPRLSAGYDPLKRDISADSKPSEPNNVPSYWKALISSGRISKEDYEKVLDIKPLIKRAKDKLIAEFNDSIEMLVNGIDGLVIISSDGIKEWAEVDIDEYKKLLKFAFEEQKKWQERLK